MTRTGTGPVTARDITAAIRHSGVIGPGASLQACQSGPGEFQVRMPHRTADVLARDWGWAQQMLSARLGVPIKVTATARGPAWAAVTVRVLMRTGPAR